MLSILSILSGVAASIGLEILSAFLASPAAPYVIAGVKRGAEIGAKFVKENPPMLSKEWQEHALSKPGSSEELGARNYFGRDGVWHRPR